MAKLITGVNDLETWCKENNHEDFLEEWDYDANKDLKNGFGWDISKPSLILPHSNIKVGWICKKGHRYSSTVTNRVSLKRGCPFCSNSKTLTGFNDFSKWCRDNQREDLLSEWDYEKNAIDPAHISPANNKKVWWKCKLNHSWEATIGSRRYSGCPFCSYPPKQILIGFNDFPTWCHENQREDLLSEWNYEKNEVAPDSLTFGSGKIIWWKCNKNHEWKTALNNRTCGVKTNCPICARTQTSFPEQAVAYYLMQAYKILQRYRIKGKEVDIYIPHYNIGIEYDGMMWHSGKNKGEADAQKTEVLRREGLSLIRIRETKDKVEVNKTDGQYIIEFIAVNGRYITDEFHWAIVELFKIINSITKKDVIPEIDLERDELFIRNHYMNYLENNSVAAVFPELINEWDVEKNEGLTPDTHSARNNKKVWWKCAKGHSWKATINSRTVRKLGCPYCAGQRVLTGHNDFESWCKENRPSLLDEWDHDKNEQEPGSVPKTYKDKVWWKCSKGHEWQATVYNRVNGTGCPFCNTGRGLRNKKSLEQWCKENDSPLLEEWNYKRNADLSPSDVTYGSHKKVWWKCSNGHEWQAVIKSRTYNHGCPYCSGTNKKAITGVNDLETWCKENGREYILKEWDYEKNKEITIQTVTKGSHKVVHWKCKNGHEWQAQIKYRTAIHGSKCPYCSEN